MNQIAFFDFDGTITKDDSLIKFTRFIKGDVKTIIGMLFLLPMLIAYKLRLIPNYKAKQIMLTYFFKGVNEKEFKKVANEYSLRHIDTILRLEAMKRIQWHKEQGHKVVIVSASIECWLKPWCKENNLELIATKLKIKNGIVTGEILGKNCFGKEKVNRIKERYALDKFQYIYAYGDSSGDLQMLELANESRYKPFRGQKNEHLHHRFKWLRRLTS